ncbi:hypothetical protein EZV62_023767 [Acer yangbiense]|uniref:RNase H type-1 domain-containing protein n=1 Tax=Acer yangbiense TaxID=1000413 RepID=A0A5C7H2K4_9ROSI|nr:hypothetical protein EZV62_023767 [Acer yangbiense]
MTDIVCPFDEVNQLPAIDVFMYVTFFLSVEDLCSFCMTAWAIWNNINLLIQSGKGKPPMLVVSGALSLLSEFQMSKRATSSQLVSVESRSNPDWLAPLPGKLKLNTAVALSKEGMTIGAGAAIRDDKGLVIAARSNQSQGKFKAKIGELIALREGLLLAHFYNLKVDYAEGFSPIVVSILNDSIPLVRESKFVMNDIKALCSDVGIIKSLVVSKSGNSLALKLAFSAFFSYSFPACLNPNAMVNKALKGPCLLIDQGEITQFDVEDHRGIQRDLNFGKPSVNEIKHCLILRKSMNETGSYYLGSYHPSRWMPIGEDGKRMEGKLDLPIKEDVPKKNGLIWGAPSSNKYWKESWFFVQGNWGRKPLDNPDGMDLDIPRHFCEARTYTDQSRLTKDEVNRVSHAVQTAMGSQNFKTLVTAEKLKTFGLIQALINDRNHILDLDPILGKTIHALKSVKVVSKEDARVAERQGIAPPDNPEVADGLDFPMPTPNVVTASSHVTAPIPKTKGPKTSQTLSIPLHPKKGNSELTGSEPIDSVFRDLGPLPKQRVPKNVTADPPPILQDGDFPILPDQSLDHNVPRPSANLSGFFGGEGLTHPKPASATGPSLPDPDSLDPSFLRKCDLVAKDRDKLANQVKNLAEERTKLLADNAKLLASHEKALAAEKKKNEEGGRRIAALEKQRDSLNFHLREYERDFDTVKTELGVRAISLFKRSPAFKAFAHKEFVKGVDACKTLVRSLDYPDVADQIDESMRLNLQEADQDLKKQVSRWESDRKRKKMPLLDVHTDLEAQVRQCFGSSCPGNLWLNPLIDYGPDSESEDDPFFRDEILEEEDQGEKEGEVEVADKDFQGDTGGDS